MASNELLQNLSSSVTSSNTTEHLQESFHNFHDIVNALIAGLAVLGNVMVILVMLARQRMFKSFTNRLILHQSVIDLIGGVIFFSHQVFESHSETALNGASVYDQLACRLWHSDFLLWCVNVASTYNLVIISLERLMATCYPVKYRNAWSTDKLKYVVASSWVLSVVYNSHLLAAFGIYHGLCEFVEISPGFDLVVTAFTVTAEYLLPLTVMTISYTKILLMLRGKLAKPVNARQNLLTSAKKNVLVTLFLAVVMFVICWTPAEAERISALIFDMHSDDWVHNVLISFLACNMFVNPIIYSFKYDQFRAQLMDILRKRFGRNQIHHSDSALSVVVSHDPQQPSASTHVQANV